MMEWSPSNWRPGRLLRSARPFVPSGIRSAYALDAANDTAGNQQQQAHEAANADGDDQAMQQTMCDLVLGEIQTQMDRVHQEAEQRRQEELRLTRQPNYSWLMDWRLRAKRPLGFRESTEVELLCAKVRPGEWHKLLHEWRRRVRYADARDEVLQAFRQSVEQIVAERMQRECRLESVNERQQMGEEEQKTSAQPQTTTINAQSTAATFLPSSVQYHCPSAAARRPHTARPHIGLPSQAAASAAQTVQFSKVQQQKPQQQQQRGQISVFTLTSLDAAQMPASMPPTAAMASVPERAANVRKEEEEEKKNKWQQHKAESPECQTATV